MLDTHPALGKMSSMKKTREYIVCDLCKNETEATHHCSLCGRDICTVHRHDWEPHQGGMGSLIVRAKINVCSQCGPQLGHSPEPIAVKVNDILAEAFDQIQFELLQNREKIKCSS